MLTFPGDSRCKEKRECKEEKEVDSWNASRRASCCSNFNAVGSACKKV